MSFQKSPETKPLVVEWGNSDSPKIREEVTNALRGFQVGAPSSRNGLGDIDHDLDDALKVFQSHVEDHMLDREEFE